jgi:hypothetical protein
MGHDADMTSTTILFLEAPRVQGDAAQLELGWDA